MPAAATATTAAPTWPRAVKAANGSPLAARATTATTTQVTPTAVAARRGVSTVIAARLAACRAWRCAPPWRCCRTRCVPVVGVALFDLAIYWAHRWSHEVPALWRFHTIHHSPRHLDWVSGFHVHPADGAIVAPPFVLLLAAGFSPRLAGALAVVQLALGLFLHANVGWRWRPLHRVVITPEFHHWHHANERDAHHSNYSAFLPVWDLLFGTYHMPAHRRPCVYGIDEPLPDGLLAQLAHPLRGLPSVRSMTRHPLVTAACARRTLGVVVRDIRISTLRPRASRRPARPNA